MSVNYYWDTDQGRETDWEWWRMQDLEKVQNNVHHGKYEDVFEHVKKWRDHASNVCDEDGYWLHYPRDYTEDDCYGLAVAFLQCALDRRVRILKKLANVYRKNALEDMTVEDRYRFVRPKLKWCGFITEHTYRHLVEYPPHLLHVQRFKRTNDLNTRSNEQR